MLSARLWHPARSVPTITRPSRRCRQNFVGDLVDRAGDHRADRAVDNHPMVAHAARPRTRFAGRSRYRREPDAGNRARPAAAGTRAGSRGRRRGFADGRSERRAAAGDREAIWPAAALRKPWCPPRTGRRQAQVTNLIGFDAAWEIDVFGKFRRAIEAAQYDVDAAVAARNVVLVSLDRRRDPRLSRFARAANAAHGCCARISRWRKSMSTSSRSATIAASPTSLTSRWRSANWRNCRSQDRAADGADRCGAICDCGFDR